MVIDGFGRSKNALVAQALRDLIDAYVRYKSAVQWREAANDAAFLRDIEQFEYVGKRSKTPGLARRSRRAG
jgi:hypothetical protein